MKSTGTGNGNRHSGIGTINNGVGADESKAYDVERIVFDAEDLDSPTVEPSRQNKRSRIKRITGALLLLLLIAGVVFYFILGGKRARLDVNVRDTRTQAEKTSAVHQNPDDVTSQAIAEVRSAINEVKPSVTQFPNVTAGASQVPPNAPVTVPVDVLGGTVNPPVLSVPTLLSEQKATSTTSTSGTTGITGVDSASNTGTVAPSRRSSEHSIRCARLFHRLINKINHLFKIRLNEFHLRSLSRWLKG